MGRTPKGAKYSACGILDFDHVAIEQLQKQLKKLSKQ